MFDELTNTLEAGSEVQQDVVQEPVQETQAPVESSKEQNLRIMRRQLAESKKYG